MRNLLWLKNNTYRGEGGIRTLGRVKPYNGLAGRPVKPAPAPLQKIYTAEKD